MMAMPPCLYMDYCLSVIDDDEQAGMLQKQIIAYVLPWLQVAAVATSLPWIAVNQMSQLLVC